MAAPQNFVSVSRRPPDVEDYIDILRRYRSWIIGPTFAGLVISVVVAFFWPDMYVCSAAMEIKPGAVPNGFLPSAISSQMGQRLQEMNYEILGRDNLIVLVKKLDLYKKETARYTVEDVAETTFRKHIHIDPYQSSSNSNGAQAFRIWFEYPDKTKARQLVQELVSEFESKNVQLQSSNAGTTTKVYEDLVTSARDRYEKAQMDIANFSSDNQGRLPENFQANMMEVTTKQNSIGNVNQQIADERQKQAILESNLNNNKNLQIQAEQNMTAVVNATNQTVKNQNLINLEHDISNKKAECAAILRRYQPGYPDVLACNDQVQVLQERKDAIEKTEPETTQPGTTSRVVTNPQAAQQLNQLRADENNIRGEMTASVLQVEQYQRQLVELTKELKEAQDKINASPQIIQKYNSLNGELEMARDEYNSLSKSKQVAGTSEKIDEHGAGEQLDVLEQPITPEKPTSPFRGAIVGLGTMIGLMVGVALAGAREVKNTSLKNLKDVRAYTNLPVLSSIPLLENALLVRRKRRLAWLAWSSAVVVGSILMSGAMYYYYVITQTA
jgi:uncharacterized protein involved in exopolysaccharide biosynthesis